MSPPQNPTTSTRRPGEEREANRRWLGRVGGLAVSVEFLLVAGSLAAAFWIKFESGWIRFGIQDDRINLGNYLGLLVAGGAGLLLLLLARGAYGNEALLRLRYGNSVIARAVGWWYFLYLSLSLLLKLEPPISRVFVTLAALLAGCTLVGFRFLLHRFVIDRTLGSVFRQRVCLVGFDSAVLHLVETLRRHPELGLTPDRVFSSHPAASTLGTVTGAEGDALGAVEQGTVDCLVMAEGALSPAETIALANACERRYVPFKLIPSSFQVLLAGLHLELIGGVPVLATRELPLNQPINRLVKRCLDIVGAIVGLLLSVPVFLVAGYLIRRESPGPLLYRQRRVGRNGREFTLLKLRTMRLDAEAAGPGWTTEGDPRCLRIGAVLRRWNLDELPQFWNVLRGEMSLVGPRPERPEWIEQFEREIPHYNVRHSCKPGLTGWAQVNGLRGNTDVTQRVQFDLDYLERWTFLRDLYILVLTMVSRRNAY